MSLVDTHAHLNFPEFRDDLPAVIERAHQAGVERIVTISTDLVGARENLAIARQYDGVSVAVGLHPGNVPEVSVCDLKELRALAGEAPVVALGEIGLDYYREARDDAGLRQQQKDLFWGQLELAAELGLPVVIHNRESEADLLEILRGHDPGFRPWGVMHCFSGDAALAAECLRLGLLISYTGILTFKNAAELREVARHVPLEQVMLETDAPYLAPVPQRGRRNEPAFVPHIAEVLAGLHQTTLEEVARITTANAVSFFRLNTSSGLGP